MYISQAAFNKLSVAHVNSQHLKDTGENRYYSNQTARMRRLDECSKFARVIRYIFFFCRDIFDLPLKASHNVEIKQIRVCLFHN